MKKSDLFLLVIVTGVLLAGCGGNQETADSQDFASTDENTLTVWAWDTNFNIPIMEKAGEYYNADNDAIDLNVVEMSN